MINTVIRMIKFKNSSLNNLYSIYILKTSKDDDEKLQWGACLEKNLQKRNKTKRIYNGMFLRTNITAYQNLLPLQWVSACNNFP